MHAKHMPAPYSLLHSPRSVTVTPEAFELHSCVGFSVLLSLSSAQLQTARKAGSVF